MLKLTAHLSIIAVLTVLSQIGGLAWALALVAKRRWLAFPLIYAALSVATVWIAPLTGRVPLPCTGEAALKVQTPLYCVLNRQYVVPGLKTVLEDHAAQMAKAHPGTQVRVLDANFPFFDGFPLLPHLSHHDGRKVDLAFYYRKDGAYQPGLARSPLGYFAFEDGPTDCPRRWLSMRWNMGWLQPLWPDYPLDTARMRTTLQLLSADKRISKVFIEPHLAQSLGASSSKIRFQGCRAARHDDHIHLQL